MEFEQYLENLPLLHSWDGGNSWVTGGFGRYELEWLYKFIRNRLPLNPTILETGAGNSTITFLFLNPSKLISIAPERDLFDRISAFCQGGAIGLEPLEIMCDGSQWVLPGLALEHRHKLGILDFAFIDGCHGWPTAFVDLEYINVLLRTGGYLAIDDIQLHSCREIAYLLSEHPAYEMVDKLGKTVIFRKKLDSDFFGDLDQPYLRRRSEEISRLPNPYDL